MAEVRFNEERCKGCGICVSFCPKGIIVMSDDFNSKGYRYAKINDQSSCTGCASCARVCPDVAIEVFR